MLHGQTRYSINSRFLDELPAACLKWLTPRFTGSMTPAQFGRKTSRNQDWKRGRAGGWEDDDEYSDRHRRAADAPMTGGGPLPDWARRQTQARSGLRVGQSVRHDKFGVGVIIDLEDGGGVRAQINFGAHGIKWLDLAVAKLEAV
jgi:DNA helicase-2/ATP-dependent DNA helicase PcrA